MIQDTPLEESCKKVITKVPLTSLEPFNPLFDTSLKLELAPFTCLPSSHSLKYSFIKPMDDYVIAYSNDGLAIVDIVMEELQGM